MDKDYKLDLYKRYATSQKESSRRITRETLCKIDALAESLGVKQKRALEICVEVADHLNTITNGYLKLFFDPRIKIKLYFDEDNRTEVHT